MVEDAPAISLSWSALELDKRETRIELEITPFASIEVNGHTRAIILEVNGTISSVEEGEWAIEQANFWNTFAYSIYIRETNRLTFSLPVKLPASVVTLNKSGTLKSSEIQSVKSVPWEEDKFLLLTEPFSLEIYISPFL